MPEPCPFLSRKFPVVSIIRPTGTRTGGAAATIKAFNDDGLFIGQTGESLQLLNDLVADADGAERGS
jgi:hypothetical protein